MSILIRSSYKYRNILEKTFWVNRRFIGKVRPVTIKSKSYKPIQPYSEHFDYDMKNILLRRPVSPHTAVHKITFNMITSIAHRITGVMMASCVVTLGVSALLFPSLPQFLMTCDMPTLVHIIVKAIIAGPICYHYFSGIRKLIWCTGQYITKRKIRETGFYSIGVSAAVFVVLVFIL